MTNFKQAEPLIRKILSEHLETRNDDKELILKVWQAQGLTLSSYQQKLFKRIHSPETIRRTRQKLQSGGEFLASKDTIEKRKEKQEEFHGMFKKPEYILDKEKQVYVQI